MQNIAFSVGLTLGLLMPSAVAAAEGNSAAPQTGLLPPLKSSTVSRPTLACPG